MTSSPGRRAALRTATVLLTLAAAAALLPTAAQAQATRTWVSGGADGDDVNPCSRTAPCKTFAGAISKTAARGEINVLTSRRVRRGDDHEGDHHRRDAVHRGCAHERRERDQRQRGRQRRGRAARPGRQRALHGGLGDQVQQRPRVDHREHDVPRLRDGEHPVSPPAPPPRPSSSTTSACPTAAMPPPATGSTSPRRGRSTWWSATARS